MAQPRIPATNAECSFLGYGHSCVLPQLYFLDSSSRLVPGWDLVLCAQGGNQPRQVGVPFCVSAGPAPLAAGPVPKPLHRTGSNHTGLVREKC